MKVTKEFEKLKRRRLPEPLRKQLNEYFRKQWGEPMLSPRSTFGDALALRMMMNAFKGKP